MYLLGIIWIRFFYCTYSWLNSFDDTDQTSCMVNIFPCILFAELELHVSSTVGLVSYPRGKTCKSCLLVTLKTCFWGFLIIYCKINSMEFCLRCWRKPDVLIRYDTGYFFVNTDTDVNTIGESASGKNILRPMRVLR